MGKANIPVYDICNLTTDTAQATDLLVERFGAYLERHYAHLHFPHRHSFYHLVLFTKGGGSHTIDFTPFTVKPFQLYFMTPGQVHSWHFKGSMDGYIVNFSESLFLNFLQQPGYLERFFFFSGYSAESVCQLPASLQPKVVALFEALLQPPAGEAFRLDMMRLLLLQLFITVEQAGSIPQQKGMLQQKSLQLRGLRRLIEQHYRTLRLPKDYADLLYITPNHLNALCRELMGKTAGELIRDRVLLEAKRLLTNAAMNITEIAYELNFGDNSYFNRFFKKYTGLTPDAFRKENSAYTM